MNNILKVTSEKGERIYLERDKKFEDMTYLYTKYLESQNVVWIVESILNINNNHNKKFSITEYQKGYISIETKQKTYSISYNLGIHCMTIYEEEKDSNDSFTGAMNYVGHYYGRVEDILTDKDLQFDVVTCILNYEGITLNNKIEKDKKDKKIICSECSSDLIHFVDEFNYECNCCGNMF